MKNKSSLLGIIILIAIAAFTAFGCGSPKPDKGAAGGKVVMGRGNSAGKSILIVDTATGEAEVITEKKDGGSISSEKWGYDSMAVIGNKVVMGTYDGGSGKSILIVDTVTGEAEEKGNLKQDLVLRGLSSTTLVEDKVVMGTYDSGSILIVDTVSWTTKEITSKEGGGAFSGRGWGINSTAVVDNKTVMGGDGFSPIGPTVFGSILIVDTVSGTAKEITSKEGGGDISGGFTWGSASTAVAGNKVVMGRSYPGNSIIIVDTIAGTVKEIDKRIDGVTPLSNGYWGYDSTAVVGNKVVMGRGLGGNIGSKGKSILIVDTVAGTVKEMGSLSTDATWGTNCTVVVGNKVVMGCGDSDGRSILIVDPEAERVNEIGSLSTQSWWGFQNTVVVGNKVFMGGSRSILIIDTDAEEVKEIGYGEISSGREWGQYSTAVVGNKIIMGGDHSSILIIDTVAETVKEIGNLSKSIWWGYDSTAVVGNKVVMGRGNSGDSILIIDTVAETVKEVGGLPDATWGINSMAVVGDKVVMGRGSATDTGTSILIVDTSTGRVKVVDGLPSACWGSASMVIAGKYEAPPPRLRLFAFIQEKYDMFMNYITEWWNDKKFFARM